MRLMTLCCIFGFLGWERFGCKSGVGNVGYNNIEFRFKHILDPPISAVKKLKTSFHNMNAKVP